MSRAGLPPPRICHSCGRLFGWRRRWAKCWEQVRYCSARCGSRRLAAVDVALEQAILDLLALRAPSKTICPSEAARRVAAGHAWRRLMEPTRAAARRLAARGEVELVQAGRLVDPAACRGPIRLRRPCRGLPRG